MLGAAHLFVYPNYAFQEGPRSRKVTLPHEQYREIVEARGHSGMLGVECLFVYLHRAFEVKPRSSWVALFPKH
jgi:hypothetical protein